MDKRWVFPDAQTPIVEKELAEYRPIERQLLCSRGLVTGEQAEAFLDPDSAADLVGPGILGMPAAVERLARARAAGESIVVYGDYDVDGVTAAALLVEACRSLGLKAQPYIPNRFDEGYGLHAEALAGLRSQGVGLVVTVDCGIRSVGEARTARELGIDLIVTDHHQPGPALPEALAVLCPRREDDPYPFKHLAGVGLAHKLAEALAERLMGNHDPLGLDLTALGTIADLAPLEGENRRLVARGLRQLNGEGGGASASRPGFGALATLAGIEPGRVTATSVAFQLAPRLNAAGRLDSAWTAYHLLTTESPAEALELARGLDDANRRRQSLTAETVVRARELALLSGSEPDILIACDPSFNEGVVGLAAARLVDEFYRPALVVVIRQEDIRGSGRSIPEFHLTQALDACAELLTEYGGHAMAAGFTAARSNQDALFDRLQAQARAALSRAELRPELRLDAVARFADLGEDLMAFLDRFEPCGFGNARPLLATRKAQVVRSRSVGAEGKHLKLTLRDGGRVFDAIAFRQGAKQFTLPGVVDVAYHLERNRYLGVESLQLNVVDIRAAA